MSQLITINLSKGPGASWGFRLQGGKDFAQPLCIQKVNVGSVAEAAGVAAGDAIVSIGGTDALALRHKEAQDTIVKAGSSFQMVVQRGAMTWKPQVTALSQPKKTPEGPVATQTSLAAPGKQPTKNSPRLNNIGSSHNNSPKPFPGPATWATSPHQSPPSYPNTPLPTPTNAYNNINNNYSPMKPLDLEDSSSFSGTRARSLSRSTFGNGDLPSYSTETRNESRSLSHSMSKTSLRGYAGSPEPDYAPPTPSSRPYSAYGRRNTNESLNESMNKTMEEFKSSSSYYTKSINNNTTTKRSTSSSNLSSKFTNFSNENLHHDYVPTDGDCLDYRGQSPPLPPPPPLATHPESRYRSPERSTSPTFYAVNPSSSQTSVPRTNGGRGNRSPSPYYNSNYSRTPRSISPSCSIPSLPSTSSAAGCGGSNSSLPSPTVKSQVLDPVSDLELKNSLKIPGADISLDKENARNFLRKELERERGRDFNTLYTTSGGARKTSTTANNAEYIEDLKEAWNNTNGRETFKTRKFSQDSSSYGANKFGNTNTGNNSNSSLINASIKNHFTNKSSDNLYCDANTTNNTPRVPASANPGIVSSVGSVSDNIRRFNSGRRHSSFTPPQIAKNERKARTLDRTGNSSYQRTTSTPIGDAMNNYNSRCRTLPRNTTDDSYSSGPSLQRTPYTGSCANLSSNSILLSSSPSDNRTDEPSGTNCNVPWKNHFSKLRRKSEGPAAIRSRLETIRGGPGPDHVNGQPVVNPQYNSPINLYNEDNIAEALSAQSEVLGKGCLGVNFMKNDRHGTDKESDVLRMVQEMDKAPKTPPVATGTSSVYCAPITPSEMIGTPEVPVQGASFRILERYLSGEDDKGSSYYNINDKMYCDVHAKQAAKHNPPGPGMVPVTVKPGAAPPAGAMPASAVKAPAPLAAAPPAFIKPPPPGGVRILPAPNFGRPAAPYKRPNF